MLLFIIAVRWVCRQSNHINANTTDNCYPNFLSSSSSSSKGDCSDCTSSGGARPGSHLVNTRWHHWAEFLLLVLLSLPGYCSISRPVLSSLNACTYTLRDRWHKGARDTLTCRLTSIKCWRRRWRRRSERSASPASPTCVASCLKSAVLHVSAANQREHILCLLAALIMFNLVFHKRYQQPDLRGFFH